METKKSLNISQASELLPFDYKPLIKRDSRNNIYETKNGDLISFSSSKDYDDFKWWYSIYIYNLANRKVKNICFIIGIHGIILLPIKLLLDYSEYADFKEYPKGNRYYIRIKKRGDDFVMYHSRQNDINIQKYYIPNDCDDSYIDDMNSESLASIYHEAQQFTNYENQYYYVNKEVKP